MHTLKVFSRTFGESGLDNLKWEQTKRISPLDIGPVFNYDLQGSEIKVSFGQDYYNRDRTFQYLCFSFGKKSGRYDNPLGGTDEIFRFLEEAYMTFYRGEKGASNFKISLKSQNLAIQNSKEWGKEAILLIVEMIL